MGDFAHMINNNHMRDCFNAEGFCANFSLIIMAKGQMDIPSGTDKLTENPFGFAKINRDHGEPVLANQSLQIINDW